jgi:uncharacterized protein GlcG (DUF336 family)
MSLKTILTRSILATSLLAAGAAFAQAPNPMDVVPEKMPNDIPYGAPISLDKAEAVLNAALAESKKRDWKLICAVVDTGGHLVSFKRQDGSQIASIAIAEHKAKAASQFRRETVAFERGIQAGNNYLITLDGVIGSRGGIPILDGGKLVGAIGCSGGTGSQDEVVAKAGIAAYR